MMRRDSISFLIPAVVSLLLSGCFTTNVSKDFQFTPESKVGLVFASVTVSGDRPGSLFIQYRTVGSKEAGPMEQIAVISPLVDLDWGAGDTSLIIPDSKPAGRLMAISLPPGRYEFYRWHGQIPPYQVHSIKPFSFQFESVPGKALYIGNVHIRFEGRRFRMGVLDQPVRDMTLMRQKVPKVRDDQIDAKLMEVTPVPGT